MYLREYTHESSGDAQILPLLVLGQVATAMNIIASYISRWLTLAAYRTAECCGFPLCSISKMEGKTIYVQIFE